MGAEFDDERLIRPELPAHVRDRAAASPSASIASAGNVTGDLVDAAVVERVVRPVLISPVTKCPAQSIAAIMSAGVGNGLASVMPTRSMRILAGSSSQRSKPWRRKSLREPGVVGSQLGPRWGPPI